MGLFFFERRDLSQIGYWTVVVLLASATMGVAGEPTPSTQTLAPSTSSQETPAPEALLPVEDTQVLNNTANEVEIQRRFNNLRSELLDDRADTINWWLATTAIFLTLFGIVVVLGGYIGFRRFQEIEAEAKRYAEEARKGVEEINKLKRQAEEDSRSITRTAVGHDAERQYPSPTGPGGVARDDMPLSVRVQREPDSDAAREAEEAVREVRQNPEASPIDRAIADAYSLQQAGRIDEAIEKWHSIAKVMEGIDNDLAAHAWLSVGSLLYKKGEEDAGIRKVRKMLETNKIQESIAAFDRAIHLKPDYAKAYHDRAIAKGGLEQHEAALADFDQAIRLKPDYAAAYGNRGIAKGSLGQYESALADFDQAIRLKPDYIEIYYSRGVTRGRLGQHEAALADFDQAARLKPDFADAYFSMGVANQHLGHLDKARTHFKVALDLARKAGNDRLRAEVEQIIRELAT